MGILIYGFEEVIPKVPIVVCHLRFIKNKHRLISLHPALIFEVYFPTVAPHISCII